MVLFYVAKYKIDLIAQNISGKLIIKEEKTSSDVFPRLTINLIVESAERPL